MNASSMLYISALPSSTLVLEKERHASIVKGRNVPEHYLEIVVAQEETQSGVQVNNILSSLPRKNDEMY
jgi:GTP-sensing pleiotropic transcriptional regulator CodY